MEMSVSSDIENALILRKFNETHIEHTWSPFESDGPSHIPIFKVYLHLYDTYFEGYGSSKKKAKINAIQKFNQAYYNINNSLESIDNIPKCNKRKHPETDNENTPTKKLIVTNNPICTQISGISILHEIFPPESIVFEYEQSNKNGLLDKVIVIVSGNKYVGYGQNKKEAKEIACRNALKTLYEKQLINDKFKDQIDIFQTNYEDSKIIDNFANITNKVYQELQFENIKNKEYSVIASIIKVTKNDVNSAEVICLSTGTKCLSGNSLSLSGESLHDCHAEILSRRCLVKYFYKQLIKYVKNEPSIFIGDKNKNQFKLSQDISFHLYINTAPCGEARIFSFNDNEKHLNRLNRGLLRSKIENGAGTVLVFGREIQTFDGIAQGERLITMSCSDKLTRWNILGLQGNLLSNFVEPIYLESISIGSVFNLVHMKRTMYGRIEETICSLPQNYKLNKPQLRGYSILPRRNTAQTHHCINWIVNEGVEIVNGRNGRKIDTKLSRLCKSELAKDYLNLCRITNSLSTFTNNETQLYYDVLKSINTNYITAKESLMLAFKLNNFGTWVQKPEEMKTFELKL